MGFEITFKSKEKDKNGQSKGLIAGLFRFIGKNWKFIIFILFVLLIFYYPEQFFDFIFDNIYKFQMRMIP